MSDPYVIGPVVKALRVFQCVGATTGPISLKAVCAEVRLPKTTVFRYLRTLDQAGFISHDSKRDLYHLNVKTLSVMAANAAFQRLREVSVVHMHALQQAFGETVNLGVVDRQDIVYLEIVEGHRALRTHARVGGRDPVHATAIGKAVLAFMPAQLRQTLIPARLRKMTPRTIDTLTQLEGELSSIRTRGYAVDRSENEEGALCIGIPIFDERGAPIAGLSISGPAKNFDAKRNGEIGHKLRTTGDKISEAMARPSN